MSGWSLIFFSAVWVIVKLCGIQYYNCWYPTPMPIGEQELNSVCGFPKRKGRRHYFRMEGGVNTNMRECQGVCLTNVHWVYAQNCQKQWNWNNEEVISNFNWRHAWCQSLTWTVLSVPMWNAGWFRHVILVKGGKETWWSSELSH